MGKTKTEDSLVFIQKRTPTNAVSKQPTDESIKGLVSPPISFYALQKAYEDSFILGGIFAKLAAAGDSGWKDTGNIQLDEMLDRLDMKKTYENLLVYGNVFLEKVIDGKGQVAELLDILTDTMWVWRLGEEQGFVQLVSGKRHFFLTEEILHSKTTSIISKYYGDSKFSKAVDQIVLLAQIDQYYGRLFDQGLMSACLLVDKGDATGKKLGEKNRATLEIWLEDNASGAKNAFKTVVVPSALEKLDLDRNLDTEAFLKYRADLIESIAIALNIPVDLLTPKSSNRSTSEVAYDMLNQIIVKPMQDGFIRDLKEALRDTFGADVEKIEINPVDSKDEEKEMKVATGYKNAGIMTANEVRATLGLKPIAGGDILEVNKAPNTDT